MGERFNFILDDDSALRQLADVTNRKKAEVVRDALAVYQFLVQRVRKDNVRIYLGQDQNHLTEVAITTLEQLRNQSTG